MIVQSSAIRVVVAWAFMLGFVRAQLENENAILGVFLSNALNQATRIETEKLLKATAQKASDNMAQGSLELMFLQSIEEAMDLNITGVLSYSTCHLAHQYGADLASNSKLYMAITEAGCKRIAEPMAITMPLVHAQEDITQLVSDLRSKNTLTWTDVTIMHDETVDDMQLDKVMKILRTDSSKPTSVVLLNLSKFETLSIGLGEIFQELGPRPGEPRDRQFLAIVKKDHVSPIQEMARRMMLTGPTYQWLYMISDTNMLNYDMTPFLDTIHDGDNVAFAFNKSDDNPSTDCNANFGCYIEALVDGLANEFSKALKSELELYNQVSEEEWAEVMPSQEQRSITIIEAMKKQQELMPSCSVCSMWGIQAAEIKDPKKFDLLEVADWRPAGGLILMDDLFPHVTGGFRGRVISVASLEFPPWQIYKRDNQTGQVVQYTGLIFEVLNEIGKRLNFTYVVRAPSDGKWGASDSSGNYNGMIKMLQNNEVLLGAGAFTVSTERMSAINFTSTIDLQPYTFMIARPKELSRVLIFIEPFTNETWIWIGVTVLLMGPILYLVHKSSPYYDYYGLRDGRGLFSLQNCSWYVYSAILQQGGTKLPYANSGRVLVAFWWIFVIVVVTTYSGNLVAFLTFPQVENAVSTLKDLLDNQDKMSWGYVGDTVLADYFQTAKGKFDDIGELSEVHDSQNTALLKKIRTADHAFLEWKTNLLFTMQNEFNRTDQCDYSLGREEFYNELVAMTVPQNSPYLKHFNKEIKRLQEGGLIEKWKLEFWPKKNKCSATAYSADIGMRTVSMADMQGSFILLIIGFVGALVIYLGENLLRLRMKSLPGTGSSTRTIVKSLVA